MSASTRFALLRGIDLATLGLVLVGGLAWWQWQGQAHDEHLVYWTIVFSCYLPVVVASWSLLRRETLAQERPCTDEDLQSDQLMRTFRFVWLPIGAVLIGFGLFDPEWRAPCLLATALGAALGWPMASCSVQSRARWDAVVIPAGWILNSLLLFWSGPLEPMLQGFMVWLAGFHIAWFFADLRSRRAPCPAT